MSDIRVHEGELYVMELLWSNKVMTAKDIAKIIKEYVGWQKNTTYTVIKRLIEKGAIERIEPGFYCKAIISKQYVREVETAKFLSLYFNNSLSTFFNEYVRLYPLAEEELSALYKVIGENSRNNKEG